MGTCYATGLDGAEPVRIATLSNQQADGNYTLLDASGREKTSDPPLYKRLNTINRQAVPSSPDTPEGGLNQMYGNIGDTSRPRLPTPESSNSSESNVDQCFQWQ